MQESPAPCPPEEFIRLSDGLRLRRLAQILGVSPQMVGRYRKFGAPEHRVRLLREFIERRAEEARQPQA